MEGPNTTGGTKLAYVLVIHDIHVGLGSDKITSNQIQNMPFGLSFCVQNQDLSDCYNVVYKL